ncbi:MAG: hypothetical protein H6860_05025 [Rhodospirillales bacterium]|nr:hypothetical protein [Alphaproteobacteria bacterium]MCB9981744.1 hypothetical protein [Rhodospirillales bacterium]
MLAAALPEEDCKLILRYCAEYPELWDRLNGFMWLPSEIRPRQALRFLKSLIRQEWLRYGLDAQDVDTLFAFKRKMINFDQKYCPENLDRVETRLRIWSYDMPNALFGQRRCAEDIPGNDSCLIQEILGRIIFADARHQKLLQALRSLIREDTPEALWVKDIERLLLLQTFSREKDSAESFEDYWNQFRPEWKSMDGMMISYTLRYEHQASPLN